MGIEINLSATSPSIVHKKMAAKLDASLLLFALFAISTVMSLSLPTQCEAAANQNLITKTCNLTKFPAVCRSTLRLDPRSSSANLTGLTRIAMELAGNKANDTAGVAFKRMNNASDYMTWAESSACFNGYNISMYGIKEKGLRYFDERKYDEAYQTVDFLEEQTRHCSRFGRAEFAKKNSVLLRFTIDVKTILHQLF